MARKPQGALIVMLVPIALPGWDLSSIPMDWRYDVASMILLGALYWLINGYTLATRGQSLGKMY